jgi:hypothetical protein
MAASARVLAVVGGGGPYAVFIREWRVVRRLTAFAETMRCSVRESGLVHICIIFVRVIYAFGVLGIRLEILMKYSLSAAVFSVLFAAFVPVSHAGNFADAAMSNGQAGGGAPGEMELLGSPRTYSDPYGAPTNGRGGQRGPITNGQTGAGVTPTDKLLAQQNGYVGNPGAGAQLKGTARGDAAAGAKALLMPQAAAAAVYPTPNGLKPPGGNANAARGRDIYKSPY